MLFGKSVISDETSAEMLANLMWNRKFCEAQDILKASPPCYFEFIRYFNNISCKKDFFVFLNEIDRKMFDLFFDIYKTHYSIKNFLSEEINKHNVREMFIWSVASESVNKLSKIIYEYDECISCQDKMLALKLSIHSHDEEKVEFLLKHTEGFSNEDIGTLLLIAYKINNLKIIETLSTLYFSEMEKANDSTGLGFWLFSRAVLLELTDLVSLLVQKDIALHNINSTNAIESMKSLDQKYTGLISNAERMDLLCIVAEYGYVDTLKFLFEKYKSAEVRFFKTSYDSRKVMLWAIKGGQLDIVKFLIQNMQQSDLSDDYVLQTICNLGKVEIAKLFLENFTFKREERNFMLKYAAEAGQIKLLRFLFEVTILYDDVISLVDFALKDKKILLIVAMLQDESILEMLEQGEVKLMHFDHHDVFYSIFNKLNDKLFFDDKKKQFEFVWASNNIDVFMQNNLSFKAIHFNDPSVFVSKLKEIENIHNVVGVSKIESVETTEQVNHTVMLDCEMNNESEQNHVRKNKRALEAIQEGVFLFLRYFVQVINLDLEKKINLFETLFGIIGDIKDASSFTRKMVYELENVFILEHQFEAAFLFAYRCKDIDFITGPLMKLLYEKEEKSSYGSGISNEVKKCQYACFINFNKEASLLIENNMKENISGKSSYVNIISLIEKYKKSEEGVNGRKRHYSMMIGNASLIEEEEQRKKIKLN